MSVTPRRRHFLLAALVWTAFITYGSIVPLQFHPVPVAEALARFRALPPPSFGLQFRSDVATNVLIFIPLTFLWMAASAADRRTATQLVLAALAVPCALATAVALESAQLWFQGRTPSMTDITAETAGGVVGIALWFIAGQASVDWLRSYGREGEPWSRGQKLLGAYTLGFLIFSVMPLDLTLSVTELYQKYRAGRVLLVPFSYDYDSPLRVLYQFGADILLFVPVGAWLALTLRHRRPRWHPIVFGALAGAVVATALELVQLLVISRYTDVTDILLASAGCAVGTWAVTSKWPDAETPGRQKRTDARWLPIGTAIVGYTLFLMMGFWLPFDITLDRQVIRDRMESFYALPFAALYWSAPFTALTQMLLRVLLFAPLGGLWAAASMRVRNEAVRRLLQVAGVGYAAGVALAIEVGQILMPSRVADPTEVALCTLGALIGLLTASGVLAPRQSRPTRERAMGRW